MESNQEFEAKFLQSCQEYAKNLTTEPLEWLKPHLSVGKKRKGSKYREVDEAKNSSQVDFLMTQAHSHMEEHASFHDEEVCIEEDQYQEVICEEAVDTIMLEDYDTSTHDEVTYFPTYYDYEDNNTPISSTPSTLTCGAHDTNTCDRQVDGMHVEDAYEDVDVIAPTYDEDATPFPFYDPYDEEGMMLPIYHRGWVFE